MYLPTAGDEEAPLAVAWPLSSSDEESGRSRQRRRSRVGVVALAAFGLTAAALAVASFASPRPPAAGRERQADLRGVAQQFNFGDFASQGRSSVQNWTKTILDESKGATSLEGVRNLTELSLQGFRNMTEQASLEATKNKTQAALQRMTEKLLSVGNNLTKHALPDYADGDREYYDSGSPILGSWHWISCHYAHMHTSPQSLPGGVKTCCCDQGFAYVAKNGGTLVGKGAAAGAASGALVTGALLGHDLGASTAAGAGTGAMSGAAAYAMEGGQCQRKEELDKTVRAHLS